MGLSPVRESRVPCVVDVIGRFRCPVRVLAIVIDDPIAPSVSRRMSFLRLVWRTRLLARCSRAESFTGWALGLKQCSLHLGNRV